MIESEVSSKLRNGEDHVNIFNIFTVFNSRNYFTRYHRVHLIIVFISHYIFSFSEYL